MKNVTTTLPTLMLLAAIPFVMSSITSDDGPSVPDAVGSATRDAEGRWTSTSPDKAIKAACPDVVKVIDLSTGGWNWDREDRMWQDYEVGYPDDRRDTARFWLDDGAVRCPVETPLAPIRVVNTRQAVGIAADPATQIIDVRSPDEFAAAHLARAINIPIDDPTFATNTANLARDKQYMIYGGWGDASARATTAMKDVGFTKIADAGAFFDLNYTNIPTESQ